MRVPVSIGQYVPGDSPVHRLDARVKMGLVAALTVGLFTVDGFSGLGALALAVAYAVRSSTVPWRIALRGVKAVTLVLAITLLAHAVRYAPSGDAFVRVGQLAIEPRGLLTGAFFAVRIIVLVVGTSLLTLTTSPVDLTDGLERLMRPLRRLGFPAGDVAMMLTIALRFIPTTAQEAERIIIAQMARGARFDVGGPIARARAFTPVLVPLFVNLFRRADALATAMEARCYRGGEGRTRLRVPVMGRTDWTVLVLGAMLLVAIGWVS